MNKYIKCGIKVGLIFAFVYPPIFAAVMCVDEPIVQKVMIYTVYPVLIICLDSISFHSANGIDTIAFLIITVFVYLFIVGFILGLLGMSLKERYGKSTT